VRCLCIATAASAVLLAAGASLDHAKAQSLTPLPPGYVPPPHAFGAPPPMARTMSTGCRHSVPVMSCRRTPISRHPAMAHPFNTDRCHPAMCHRRTLTGRHPDIAYTPGTVRHHPATCCRPTPMGRRLVMAHLPAIHLPATVHHHARTSPHRTRLGRHQAMAHLAGTVRHRSTVRHHALLSLRRTQFRGRALTPGAQSSRPSVCACYPEVYARPRRGHAPPSRTDNYGIEGH
jgi:hypothetical protein